MIYKQNELHINKFPDRKICGKLTKTNKIVLGDNGNHTHTYLKRTLYKDENDNLFAKYFGNWWKYPEDIENYGIIEK